MANKNRKSEISEHITEDGVPSRGRADPGRSFDKARGRVAVIHRPISELQINPRNPRVHSKHQIRQIARSIEAFGFNVPVLIDSDLKVVCGHGRILACQELGWTEVPTIRLEHLTEVQAKAFMIADNRLIETSLWDDRLLGEQLKELSLLDLDFSLEATGFEMGEIDLRIEGLTSENTADDDSADHLPAASAGPVAPGRVTSGRSAFTASIAATPSTATHTPC
jgi:ParB-like chromosome segregation protein Spo0J